MKIKLVIFTVIFTAALFCASADSYWEGAASMSRYGEFPVNGYYGASNSFPLNSIVEVSSFSGKKKVEVIIVNKLEDNNLFLLLSKDAAEKLSIREDVIVTVKARIVKRFTADDTEEKDLSDDPDFNPASTVLLSEPEDEKTYSEEVPEEAEKENVPAGGNRDLSDEIIETLIFSDIPYEKEEAAEEEVEEKAVTGEDMVTAVIVTDTENEKDAASEVVPEEEELLEKYNPDEVIIPETESAEEFEEKLVLVPASPKPPVEKTEASTETESSLSVVPDYKKYSSADIPSQNLDKNSYYLQIGAFRDFESADSLAKKVNIDYPVFLYKMGENGIYKVMAGPLKNDEKGAALYQVRIKGINDAFIRKGE